MDGMPILPMTVKSTTTIATRTRHYGKSFFGWIQHEELPALTDVSMRNLLRELPGQEGDGNDEVVPEGGATENSSEIDKNDIEEAALAKKSEEEEEKGEEEGGEVKVTFDTSEVVRRRASTIRPNEAKDRKLTSVEVNTLIETDEVLKKVAEAEPPAPAPAPAQSVAENTDQPPTPPIGTMLTKTASDDDLPEPEVIGEKGTQKRMRRSVATT